MSNFRAILKKTKVIIAPKIPVNHTHFRNIIIALLDRILSSVAFAVAMSLTALNELPKPVIAVKIDSVELKSDEIPNPLGPRYKATNLDFTNNISIVTTCTPPKILNALLILRYEVLSKLIKYIYNNIVTKIILNTE